MYVHAIPVGIALTDCLMTKVMETIYANKMIKLKTQWTWDVYIPSQGKHLRYRILRTYGNNTSTYVMNRGCYQ